MGVKNELFISCVQVKQFHNLDVTKKVMALFHGGNVLKSISQFLDWELRQEKKKRLMIQCMEISNGFHNKMPLIHQPLAVE